MKIAHLINPVYAEKGSWLRFVQEVTSQTMVTAAEHSQDEIDVEFISVQYPEDHAVIPEYFCCSPDLNRSILDFGTFTPPKKYPLVTDILDLGCRMTDAEYVVLSNVDIHLQPYFYRSLQLFISSGSDALVINRRSISDQFSNLAEIPMMYSKIGELHRGWDCFVFKREIAQHFFLGEICIGVPMVGLALYANIMAYSDNFLELKREHLTFHLGNDRAWDHRKFTDYLAHNKTQAEIVLRKIETDIGGFQPGTPPQKYMRNMDNPLRRFIFDTTRKIHIPAKYTRPFADKDGNL